MRTWTRILTVLGWLLLCVSCASISGLRVAGGTPRLPAPQREEISLTPSPSWPVRLSSAARNTQELGQVWSLPTNAVQAVPLAASQAYPGLPLPGIRPLVLKSTPVSRSWGSIAQVKAPTVLPAQPAAVAAAEKAKTAPKPVAPVPTAAPPAKSPPTAAATASLLPDDKPGASDFQWQDVNAVAGDAVTLHFDKSSWLYLDAPAQQKLLGFQSSSRDKDATTFVFKPLIPGQYTLEFQRQDLINQSTEVRKVKLTVAKMGTRTSATGSVLSPQTSATAANDALEASRLLAASGKTAEAVQKLLQNYRADDTRANLELAKLLNQTGQDDEALTYLDRNLTFTGPDFDGTLELGTRLAAAKGPQKKLPAYLKLWSTSSSAPPEDLYLQVLEALRTQKMTPLLKDWSAKYPSWYPAPRLRDRYLYQLGQWLEEPGEGRDVRSSWKAYNEIVQSYPLSSYWKAAGERAAYLNRHFLQVR